MVAVTTIMIPMEITNPISNIYRVKNFLDEDSYVFFKSLFESNHYLNTQDNFGRSMLSPHQYFDDQKLIDYITIYKNKVVNTVSNIFGLDLIDMSGTAIRKWNVGEFQHPHSDCEAEIELIDDNIQVKPYFNFTSLFIDYAGLTYLNDDYSGGEIYFPQYNKSFHPEPNEFITFPGTNRYIHGVKTVTNGSRHVLQNFMATLKSRYIWENFVIDEKPLSFSPLKWEDATMEKTCYNRSNIPEYFIFNKHR